MDRFTNIPFKNRFDAGKKLAPLLRRFSGKDSLIVALPRGGVQIGYEVSKFLKIPLTVFVVRKVGHPHNPEFGIGAVSETNEYIQKNITKQYLLSKKDLDFLVSQEKKEVLRGASLYRNNKVLVPLENKMLIVVDDGVATGVTGIAALRSLRKFHPKALIFSSPVGAEDSIRMLSKYANDVICPIVSNNFTSVSSFYKNFPQVQDAEVQKFLSSIN